jgi:alpha-galactosidase
MLALEKLIARIRNGEVIPVSLRLDGRPARIRLIEAEEGVLAYDVAGAKLRVQLRMDRDAEADMLRLAATIKAGDSVDCRVSHVRILDLRVDHDDHDVGATLRTWTGGTVKHYTAGGFPPAPFRIADHFLRGHDIAHFREDAGRGSNRWMPIWLYGQDEGGIWFGPEWQGCWELEVYRLPESSSLLLGLPGLDFRPEAGEEIPLPTVAVGTYTGDLQDGGNRIRKVIGERYLPDIGDQRPEPPMCYQVLGGHPDWMSDPKVFEEVEVAAQLGAETFTWSSFWQFALGFNAEDKNWWDLMGPYAPHQSRFPEGIEPLAEACEKHDMRLGLWVDPRFGLSSGEAMEEVRDRLLFFDEDAWEAEARKKYNELSYEINVQPLIDLARPKGRELFLSILKRMVEQYAARWIWFDMNTDPAVFHFIPNESPDRQGLLELQWYQGLDAVMEQFRAEHPDVWIEWCASGGRMINLAVCRYSHSHWITDYVGPDPDIANAIRAGANTILPAVCNHQSFYLDQRQMDNDEPISVETALAHFAGCFGLSQGLREYPQKDLAVLERMAQVWKGIRHLLSGDFYLLQPQAESRDAWEAWQFHRWDLGEGIACIQRLRDSDESAKALKLRGCQGRSVQVEPLAGDATVTAFGDELTIELADDRAVLVRYRTH